MRALFSVVGLLLVLAIVGVLVKKQLSSAPLMPASAVGLDTPAAKPANPAAVPPEPGKRDAAGTAPAG